MASMIGKDFEGGLAAKAVPYSATERERETFEAGRDSMQQGSTGTPDQLADYPASAGDESACS